MVQFLDLGDGCLGGKGTGEHQPVLCKVTLKGPEPQDQKKKKEQNRDETNTQHR
jgi:hypothetical protein